MRSWDLCSWRAHCAWNETAMMRYCDGAEGQVARCEEGRMCEEEDTSFSCEDCALRDEASRGVVPFWFGSIDAWGALSALRDRHEIACR